MRAQQWWGVALSATMATASPVSAATPRDLLTQASFGDRSKDTALHRVEAARQAATAALGKSPDDREAFLMQATALGYQAKLTGSRSDAIAARKQFEALLQRDPRNAEAQLALGAWHIGAVYRLGRLMARAALGAQKDAGLAALDRAVSLGGNRALFPGLSALLRLELDPADARGRALAEAASRAAASTPLDQIVQRASIAILAQLRAGNPAEVKATASRLLPFGRLPGES